MPPAHKVVVVGAAGAGKSTLVGALVRTWRRKAPSDTPLDATPTVGVDFHCVALGDAFAMQVWDTAGQERYASLSTVFVRSAALFVAVYDASRADGFRALMAHWVPIIVAERARAHELRARVPRVVVVAAKSDLVPASADYSVERAAIDHEFSGAPFVCTSALDRASIERAADTLVRVLAPRRSLPSACVERRDASLDAERSLVGDVATPAATIATCPC